MHLFKAVEFEDLSQRLNRIEAAMGTEASNGN